MQDITPVPKNDGLDTLIKVLTVLKLFVQLAFYGLLLGGALWFLIKNPLPEMIQDVQDRVIDSFMQEPGR